MIRESIILIEGFIDDEPISGVIEDPNYNIGDVYRYDNVDYIIHKYSDCRRIKEYYVHKKGNPFFEKFNKKLGG